MKLTIIKPILSFFYTTIFLIISSTLSAQQSKRGGKATWQMQSVSIQTRWAKQVTPQNALPEYPRPQLVRKSWDNLNGLWDYTITTKQAAQPISWTGKILVPYPLESALSGIKKNLLPDQLLWYRRSFSISAITGHVLLHFGAVDYQATIYINGKEAGYHEGGYTAFELDITKLIHPGSNELQVRVWDPTDQGYGPHGKQTLQPRGIYYTGSSGIWQTVWLETVPDNFIQKLVIAPDIDKGAVDIIVHSSIKKRISLQVEGQTFYGQSNDTIRIPIKHVKPWSPGHPYLYDLTVRLGNDLVQSYFGMRKISTGLNREGNKVIMLNNQPYFNLGTLDQGFWPEGLYTAPTDEALKYDIAAIKAMGFNTIRKHIKVEPARWYYWADKLGMLVWQDMVNPNRSLPEGSKAAFEKENKATIDQLYNSPSIVCWVLFNEHWGQFDQERLTRWLKNYDNSRVVNGHSGEYCLRDGKVIVSGVADWAGSELADVHAYPFPALSAKQNSAKSKIIGEFGGIGVFIPDHQWNPDNSWGYIREKPSNLKTIYQAMTDSLVAMRDKAGLAASVYTQPFDVEGEQNGLMTYDREVVKVPFAELRKINRVLNTDAEISVLPVLALNADLTDPEVLAAQARTKFINGDRAKSTWQSIVRNALNTGDKNFGMMLQYRNDFCAIMGTTVYGEKMRKLIFEQEISPLFAQHKSWQEINNILVSKFDTVGEEAFLKVKIVGTANAKDWEQFIPTAKLYLMKYKSWLTQAEQTEMEQMIQAHQ